MLPLPVQSPEEEVNFLSLLQGTVGYSPALLARRFRWSPTLAFLPLTMPGGMPLKVSILQGAALFMPKCETRDLMLA